MSDELVKLRELATEAAPAYDRWQRRGRIKGDDPKLAAFGKVATPTTVLALLDRIEALQRLCGRAAVHIGADCNDYCPKEAGGDCVAHALATELRKAAGK